MREVWNGTGDAEGCVYFTKNNGEIVGRPYAIDRARAYLSDRHGRFHSVDARRAAIDATLGNDAWCVTRAGYLVSALCRDVAAALYSA